MHSGKAQIIICSFHVTKTLHFIATMISWRYSYQTGEYGMTDREILEAMADIIRPVIDRLDQLDSRMDQLDNRMDKLEGRMDQLEGRIRKLPKPM